MQEVTLQCPYDKAHLIRPMRMGNHLVKCRRNFPNQMEGVCKWNEYHRVLEKELQYHENQCSDKDHQASRAGSGKKIYRHIPDPSFVNICQEGDEDWGQELGEIESRDDVPYFQYPNLDGKFVMFTPKFMTKKKKKEWKEAQREKFQENMKCERFASHWSTRESRDDLSSCASSSYRSESLLSCTLARGLSTEKPKPIFEEQEIPSLQLPDACSGLVDFSKIKVDLRDEARTLNDSDEEEEFLDALED